jgi:putative ABC transport system ATP-binding protein
VTAVIEARDLWRVYGTGETAVKALAGFDLTVEQGEFVAIMGASGSGKSTAMNILGLLDEPDSGSYAMDGMEVASIHASQASAVRNRKIGFVFQSFNLIARMSALRNVELPALYSGKRRKVARALATEALATVGLADRMTHLPGQLSGGQQQRVAVARALVNEPALILADEPTGNLDSASATQVLDVLDSVHATGRTIVLITHDPDVANRADWIAHMRDGRVVAMDVPDHSPEQAPVLEATVPPRIELDASPRWDLPAEETVPFEAAFPTEETFAAEQALPTEETFAAEEAFAAEATLPIEMPVVAPESRPVEAAPSAPTARPAFPTWLPPRPPIRQPATPTRPPPQAEPPAAEPAATTAPIASPTGVATPPRPSWPRPAWPEPRWRRLAGPVEEQARDTDRGTAP